ncbi:hypothetical protein EMIHUDRAFT_235208 [Emiliania huxleyi CCMP1516]|uniref:Uncharacterized protein n=2 Tax=Emiliania huxleyi TaxID=2903 RepID=A0A0D3JWY6_EMIH1|nr:hypothetical protein EMIHUDRAFT_237789 [Emiliania huxleyi CCMP1516]XP_005780450.1 hypothetical protein EMIHUDRAFT_235208 [Emiliania huxleyi CCMP1516]EOD25360.1 hypothetical protein EMIHUDRAFT_237789 [Emiliania huxleyi CCMP1516]EOD28021.1 hypothetical protein EMIHUDRAFT_235208 [Emiliania huxleyi CCMP1516]|eukprot:XP_005777789.1 hypothetical protein EMIHUDRAFT_237789 [Emiliania huxleyi CCMP1516]
MPNDSRSIRVLLHRHSSPAPQAVQAPASTTILQLKERWYGGGAPCGAAGVVLRLGSPDGRRAYNSMSLAEVSAGSDAVVLWWEEASPAAAPAASPASSSASTATAALIVGLDSLADFGAYDAQTSLCGECVLWPSGVLMARFLERRAEALQLCGSRLVELGAGSALPSVVAACGPRYIVGCDILYSEALLAPVLEARFLDPELCLFELTRRLPPTQGARAAKRALDIECSG